MLLGRLCLLRAFLLAQKVKNLPAMQGTWVQSLGQEDPLEKGMATHSSILEAAWLALNTDREGVGKENWNKNEQSGVVSSMPTSDAGHMTISLWASIF